MKELTERALEDAILEADKVTKESGLKLTIKPTKLFIRVDLLEELAAERGISLDEMLVIVEELVRKATDAPQLP